MASPRSQKRAWACNPRLYQSIAHYLLGSVQFGSRSTGRLWRLPPIDVIRRQHHGSAIAAPRPARHSSKSSLIIFLHVTKEFPHVVSLLAFYVWMGRTMCKSVVALVSMSLLALQLFPFVFPGSILAFLSRGFDYLKLSDVKFLPSYGRRGWMSHLRFVRVLPKTKSESRTCFFLYSPLCELSSSSGSCGTLRTFLSRGFRARLKECVVCSVSVWITTYRTRIFCARFES